LSPEGARPVASVVVPAFNAAATIGRTLAALAAQDLEGPYEVIVVDNGSEDATAEVARRAAGPVTVIRKERGRPGSARNRGAQEARAEVLAFTDADCAPTPGWLREGLGALRDAELVQGAVLPDPEARLGPFDRTVWVTSESGLYETASLFVSASLFARVGGFEDIVAAEIGAPFGEDVRFGWKARRAGARTSFRERALVHHAVFPRGAGGYVAERLRARFFPALAAGVPELRRSFFFGRLFLSRRSAAFDAAAAGIVLAAGRRSALPLMAAAPYAWISARKARRWGSARVAAVDAVADAVGLCALAWGSVRSRTPVL
jgi:glycosyltransferase involved in cell wall biosynthesis